jgi:hypothetical protein
MKMAYNLTEARMQRAIASLMFAALCTIPVTAQQNSMGCKVYFEVVQDYPPEGPSQAILQMDQNQQEWWDKEGRKIYPGFCLDYSKAQYVLVWDSGMYAGLRDIPQVHTQTVPITGTVVDNQTGSTSTLSGTTTQTTTTHRLEERTYFQGEISVFRIVRYGYRQTPAIYFAVVNRSSQSHKALERALKFLSKLPPAPQVLPTAP